MVGAKVMAEVSNGMSWPRWDHFYDLGLNKWERGGRVLTLTWDSGMTTYFIRFLTNGRVDTCEELGGERFG